MSGQKPQQPRVEWGFYAMVPRIVRTKYHDLSHAEKWLYTCLKDLCGDKGSCFRSLRSLSEETDISIASLSKMVPNLHQVGLIRAEKKRRSESGKEIWHISIVDIWQLNAEYCLDCSKNKQSQSAQTEIVQNPNEVVQKINNDMGDCSKSERGCSNFSDRRITLKNNTEEYDSEEKKNHRVATASATSPSSFLENPSRFDEAFSSPSTQEEAIEETSEVHRLTNEVTPSSSVQIAADELPRRIEAETQEQIPTLPVVDMPKNAAITVKKQNDANIPIVPDSQKTAEKKPSKRSGKAKQGQPIVVDLTPEEQARIAEEKEKEEARAERHRGVLARIVARRGFALEDKQDIINEHKFINKLLDKYTDAQIDRIHRYLMEEDWKWSKVDNKFTIGAYIIWKESSRVAQTLRDRREQSLKDQREGVHRKTAIETGTLSPQTRQPSNVIEAPKDWIEKRAAGGGK